MTRWRSTVYWEATSRRHFANEFAFAHQPAGLIGGARPNQDDVLIGARILPQRHESLGVLFLALADGVQPEDDGMGDVRVVVLGDVDPVFMIAGGVAALEHAGLDLLGVFLLRRRGRHRRCSADRLLRLQSFLDR